MVAVVSPSRIELIKAVLEAAIALREESAMCPWCSLGYENNHTSKVLHGEDCILVKILELKPDSSWLDARTSLKRLWENA